MQCEIQPGFIYKQIKEYTVYSSDLALLTPKVEAGCFAEMLVSISAICHVSAQKIMIWTLMAVKTLKTYIISTSCLPIIFVNSWHFWHWRPIERGYRWLPWHSYYVFYVLIGVCQCSVLILVMSAPSSPSENRPGSLCHISFYISKNLGVDRMSEDNFK